MRGLQRAHPSPHMYKNDKPHLHEAARADADTLLSCPLPPEMLACCFWPVETKQLYDPVAYRLEPLLDKRLRDLQPEHVSPAAGQSRLMSSGTCGPKFLAPCPLSASSVLGVFRSLGVVDPVDIRALRRRQLDIH